VQSRRRSGVMSAVSHANCLCGIATEGTQGNRPTRDWKAILKLRMEHSTAYE